MATAGSVNERIAQQFYQKAGVLQERGDRFQFRALSYVRAARAIEQLDRGLDEIYERSWLAGLQKIKGIGNRLAHEIERELKRNGLLSGANRRQRGVN
ncbi:MAG: hypothetical protein WC505_07830 [Patescibacteria group bacterium]